MSNYIYYTTTCSNGDKIVCRGVSIEINQHFQSFQNWEALLSHISK